MARTVLPLKALKLTESSAKNSLTSTMRSGFRRSGLSEPYFSMASSYGMRTKGASVTCQSENSLKVPTMTGSMAAKTSSCVTKLISMSSW